MAVSANMSNLPDSLATKSLMHWLKDAQTLARMLGLPSLEHEINGLIPRASATDLRVAFVGEPGRGKSWLINRLLRPGLVPEGHTLSWPVVITDGRPERIEWRQHPDSPPIQRPLRSNVLTTEFAHASPTTASVDSIELVFEDSWLRKSHLTLVDTPSSADLSAQARRRAERELQTCDAAVLAISARMPFSASERVFLEREVIGRSIERVIVVVTHLDEQIPREERERAFTYVQTQVTKVAPGIPVVPSAPLNRPKDVDGAIKELRRTLEQTLDRSTATTWRAAQLAARLLVPLSQIIQISHLSARWLQMDASQRQAIQAQWQQLAHHGTNWEAIRTASHQQVHQAIERMRAHIAAAGPGIIETLTHSLDRENQDPANWWTNELTFQLDREYSRLAASLEPTFAQGLVDHAAWLRTALDPDRVGLIELDGSGTSAPKLHLDLAALQSIGGVSWQPVNIDRLNNYLRIGGGTISIITLLIQGPVAAAVSAGFTLMADQVSRIFKDKDRDKIHTLIPELVKGTLNIYQQRIAQQFTLQVTQQIELARHAQELWDQAISQVAAHPTDGSRMARAGHDALAIRQEILQALRLA